MLSSFKILLPYVKILTENAYNDDDLIKIYQFLLSIDFDELKEYFNYKNVFSYPNDLEVYYDVVLMLIKIFQEVEKYEECHELMKKINQCKIIILKNQFKDE
jgi:hypothetical protein